jgi:hypothetical protein
MAVPALPSDMKVYNEQFYAGYTERVMQNLAVFNGSSANALRLTSKVTTGEFIKESFFQDIPDLVTRRDITSNSSAGAKGVTQGEIVKVDRSVKIGPVTFTDEAVHKGNMTLDEVVFKIGQQAADKMLQEQIDAALFSLNGAYNVAGLASLVEDQPSATLTPTILNNALFRMGDRQGSIIAWVMHSGAYQQLVNQAISDKIVNVADGVVLYGATPGTFGRPVIVTDSEALYDNGASATSTDNEFISYGLVAGAAEIQETRIGELLIERVGGNENIFTRVQGEQNHTVGLKGLSFNTATKNPTMAQLATNSNWTKVYSELKAMPGVQIRSKKANALG